MEDNVKMNWQSQLQNFGQAFAPNEVRGKRLGGKGLNG
jgi:hypothetical protein